MVKGYCLITTALPRLRNFLARPGWHGLSGFLFLSITRTNMSLNLPYGVKVSLANLQSRYFPKNTSLTLVQMFNSLVLEFETGS